MSAPSQQASRRPAQVAGARNGEAAPAGPASVAPTPNYDAPEYRALKRAHDEGDVSFHQVATAWFNWHFGGERCEQCAGTGRRVKPPRNGSAARSVPADDAADCPRCHGHGTAVDPATARAYEEIFPDLMRVFSKQRNGVISAYFCEHIRVAAALTDIWSAANRADGRILSLPELEQEKRDEEDREREEKELSWIRQTSRRIEARLHFHRRHAERASSTAIHLEPMFGDPDSPRAKQILFRCMKVHHHALEYLTPKPRKICLRMTFNVITTLLGTLDSRAARGQRASAFESSYDDQRTLEQELANTENYYLTSARRTARLEYLSGVVFGVPLAAAAAFAIYMLEWAPRELAICFVAGAVGALVSVMERLTANKLTLNHEAGKATLRILGTIRPFFGALFGLAVFVFISGQIFDVQVPDGEARRYFFAAIAFLAGFSERFARDVIDPSKLPGVSPPRAELPSR